MYGKEELKAWIALAETPIRIRQKQPLVAMVIHIASGIITIAACGHESKGAFLGAAVKSLKPCNILWLFCRVDAGSGHDKVRSEARNQRGRGGEWKGDCKS